MAPSLSLQLSSAAVLTFLTLLLIQKLLRRREPHLPLPPGPGPLPLIGNILDLPPAGVPEFQHWLHHKDAYGPISSITVLGQPLIIFHDKDAARAVMGKQAQRTSARPRLNFAALCGFEEFLITHQYDDKYRAHRKMVHQAIGTKGLSAGFRPVQEEEARRFVVRTFRDPGGMMGHLKTLAAAIILKIVYGYSIERDAADPLVDLIEHAMDNLSQAFVPLSWAVDAVPALQYLPDWIPGTSYRKTARKFQAINEAAAELPYSYVKRRMAQEAHRPSYVSNLLQQQQQQADGVAPTKDEEEAIKWTAVSLYAAGSDSTVAIMQSVILALLLHPSVVLRAQEEIDRVIGPSRLPTFSDRASLPYIDGIVKEAWRWNPVGPMGLTHKSTEDIAYAGYLIPAGSYLLPSLWWFLHDPREYTEPMAFKPERYLAPLHEADPSEVAFGYGRRACAGRFFADASVYITVAQMLAVFRVGKAVDERGDEVEVKLEAVVGMVNRPKAYKFKVEPRSEYHAELLRRMEAEQGPMVGDASLLDIGGV
ncbi:MAG: hypothetical protein LQ344_004085 [Seirophora lacunosa]|nr:MAG: hypothetical protein LQ344_004085 [Seirophora lacunosa]